MVCFVVSLQKVAHEFVCRILPDMHFIEIQAQCM